MISIEEIRRLGPTASISDFCKLAQTSDERFAEASEGMRQILATKDGKVEFVFFDNNVLAYVNSAMGYPAYYPVYPAEIKKPVKALLMDIDGPVYVMYH
jgi:hypothetical protein